MGVEPYKRVLTVPRPDDTDYVEVPGSNGAFQMKPLRGDLAKEAGTYLTRLSPGAWVPWHYHSATEEFVVLKGSVVVQRMGTDAIPLGLGGYSQLPGTHIHRFRCTEEGECVLFGVGEAAFDIHWVDEDGNPISEDEAKNRAAKQGAQTW